VKRALAILVLIALGIFGVRKLVSLFVPDETRIRELVLGMAEGFNDSNPLAISGALDSSWIHEGGSIDRTELTRALAFTFWQDRTELKRRFRRRVELDEETLAIEIGDGSTDATVSCEVRFFVLRGEEWEPDWNARFEATLKRSGGGWSIAASRHTDLAGRGLGRL
jgi:hypothetical protein